MRIRRFVAPVVLGLAAAACSGEPVAAPTPSELTSLQRAAIAERLVDAAGTSDAAPGANLAAAVIMSGAQPSRITATRAGFNEVARAGDGQIAAAVASTPEGATYNVIGFQMVDAAYADTVMGLVAWNVTADNTPTSFVVSYEFGEGNGIFDSSLDVATAFGYVFDLPSASWAATSGSAGMLRKSVGAACDSFIYPGTTADCHMATFTAALDISATAPTAAQGNTATGSRSFSLPSGYVNGVTVTVTPKTAAAVAALRRR